MRQTNQITTLIKNLGLPKSSLSLVREAVTHTSYLNETKTKGGKSYERLEFLGDSVISQVVAENLFNLYPKAQEGELTALRAALVQEKTLANVAKKMDLGEYLFLAKGEEEQGGKENNSILAACFEALIGAIYLSTGFAKAKKVVEEQIIKNSRKLMQEAPKDHKSKLQEMVQEMAHVSPQYKVLDSFGPEHQKSFLVGCYIRGKLYGSGFGRSKQEGEQDAAARALEKLENDRVKLQLELPIKDSVR